MIYADMNRYKRGFKNYVLEQKILQKSLASAQKDPPFITKCHSPLLIQILPLNKPEEPQDLELLKEDHAF